MAKSTNTQNPKGWSSSMRSAYGRMMMMGGSCRAEQLLSIKGVTWATLCAMRNRGVVQLFELHGHQHVAER